LKNHLRLSRSSRGTVALAEHWTIDMLPMVYDALKDQAARTQLRSKYVFLNFDDQPIASETLRKNAWSNALNKAKLDYRPMIQTRHTFATMMASSGENLAWIQKMMGQASLKMITDKYFSYIPNMTHHNGSKFLEEYLKKTEKGSPNVAQNKKRKLPLW
jgi:integrase